VKIDLKKELEAALGKIKWGFKGIVDIEGKIHPIPKNIQIQALFEYMATEPILKMAEKLGVEVMLAESTRAYPDFTLHEGSLEGPVAVDAKTTRRTGPNSVSGFTLGSYAGYFRQPNKKMPFCTLPYGDYKQHWVCGFIHDWHAEAETAGLVTNVELIVQEKWKLAGKSTGTGTTTAIGSIRDLADIRNGRSVFASEEEFLEYWRSYVKPAAAAPEEANLFDKSDET